MSATAASPAVSPLAGPLGGNDYAVDALAVSMTNTDLAVTTDRATTLRRAPIATGQPRTLLTDASNLLRPQFTRYGEIWEVGFKGDRQRMWMFTAGADPHSPGVPTEINSTSSRESDGV